MRALKYAKFLPAEAWTPVVISADPRAYPQDLLDPHLQAQLRQQEIVRLWYPGPWMFFNRPAEPQPWIPEGLRSRPTTLKTGLVHLGLSCDELPWAMRVMRALQAAARRTRIDAVLTMSPPGWAHLAGYYARELLGIPWVMDMRDQWSGHPAHPPPAPWAWFERRIEAACLARADAVVTATTALTAHYRALRLPARVETITNGYDPEDFVGLPQSPARRFTVAHVGSLGTSRSPQPFLRGWQRFLADAAVDPDSVACRFVGPTGRIDFSGLLAEDPLLAATVTLRPFVPHREALAEMLQASVLLLLVPDQPGAEHMLTGKLFEYLGAGRPILALTDDGDISRLLRERGAGVAIRAGNEPAVLDELRRLYLRHQAGEGPSFSPSNIEAFDRRLLSRQLAALLDSLPASSTGS